MMASYYIHQYVERGLSPRETVMMMAEQFVPACRDGGSVPEVLVEDPHHRTALDAAMVELDRLKKLPRAELLASAGERLASSLASMQAQQAQDAAESAKVRELLAALKAWTVDAPYKNLRDNAIRQCENALTPSRYFEDQIKKIKATTPDAAADEMLADAKSAVAYHRRQLASEVARIEEGNKWLAGLREAVSTLKGKPEGGSA